MNFTKEHGLDLLANVGIIAALSGVPWAWAALFFIVDLLEPRIMLPAPIFYAVLLLPSLVGLLLAVVSCWRLIQVGIRASAMLRIIVCLSIIALNFIVVLCCR